MPTNNVLVHCNKKSDFNTKKLASNADNTQYQVGGVGTIVTGTPDIKYQSIVYIKDSKEIWTHGQFYADQTLYSTTGTNTDGAMTQAAVTTALNGKADIEHEQSASTIIRKSGTGRSGTTDPIIGAYVGSIRSNKTFGLPAEAIVIEYSTDGGTTWVDYGASDLQKEALFNESNFYFKLGGPNITGDTKTTDCKLRVTIEPIDRYCSLGAVYLYINSSGNNANFILEVSTLGNPDVFTRVLDEKTIEGWTGPNCYYFYQRTFGGASTQTNNNYKYRLTFSMTKLSSTSYQTTSIGDIRFFGSSWYSFKTPGVLAEYVVKYGVPYLLYNESVIFGKNVTVQATTFSGNATSASKVNNKLTLSLNGTAQTAFDGSAAVAYNINAASVGAAASVHQHKSSDTTVMSGYSKQTDTTAILVSDSLNTAIGKLEAAWDWGEY